MFLRTGFVSLLQRAGSYLAEVAWATCSAYGLGGAAAGDAAVVVNALAVAFFPVADLAEVSRLAFT